MSRWWGLQGQLPLDAVHGSNSHVRDLGDFFHGVAIPLKQARYLVPLRLILTLACWFSLRFGRTLVLQLFPNPLYPLLRIKARHGWHQVYKHSVDHFHNLSGNAFIPYQHVPGRQSPCERRLRWSASLIAPIASVS